MQEAAETQSLMTYIGIRQSTVAQWVALQQIFEVCAGETDYDGGGCRREAWWRQGVTDKQLQETLEGIRWGARSQRRREGRVILDIWYSGTEAGEAWVGSLPRAVGRDTGTDGRHLDGRIALCES